MNEEDKYSASLIGHVVTTMTLIITAEAAGTPVIAAGVVLVLANLGRKFVKLRQEEKNGRSLTPDDIASLKQSVANTQTELNEIMGRKETAQNKKLYKTCNTIQDELTAIRKKLGESKVKHLRFKDQERIMSQLEKLTHDLTRRSS